MNLEFDVIVVGAGPCGSFSALTLLRLGAKRIAVFEEHSEVGKPQHCAGHVGIQGLKRLGLHLPKETVENEIKGAIFHSPFGRQFVVRCKKTVSLVLNRELFDKHVAGLAVKAGAHLRLGVKVKSLIVQGGVVKGVVVDDKKKQQLMTSKIVIDAEGCSASLLKRAGFPTLNTSMVIYGAQANLENVCDVEEDMVELYLGRKWAPNFFAWIIPKRDGSAKVGLGTSIGKPHEFLAKFIKKHPIASRKLRKSKVTQKVFHPITLGGPAPKTYGNGLLIVGDAASQVKPTTGGGVVFGMICARIAGEIAHKALKKENFSENFLSRYERLWKMKIGFELSTMLHLRKMLNRLSDEKIDKTLQLCSDLGLGSVLEEVGDIDFQGRTLLRLFQKPKALLPILYFGFSSLYPTHKTLG